jgi:hypothetical protein
MGYFADAQSATSRPTSLSRSSTLSSDTVGTSSSSSLATIPSSSSSSSLRAFFAAPKEYWAPSVVYPSSGRGKSVRDAKLAAAASAAPESGGGRESCEILRPPAGFSMRQRANSAAALVPPLWVAPPLPLRSRELLDDNLTIGRRSRRGSAEDSDAAYVGFVREHRRSRSATPTDRNRRPPSPKLASGKVLSPLPELTGGSGKSAMLAAMESSRRSPTKMMRSPHLATVNLLEHAVESDEEAFETSSAGGSTGGDLRFALGSDNQSSVSLSSADHERTGPPARSLQGRRPILRTHTDTSVTMKPSPARGSPQSVETIRLDFPIAAADKDRQLPLLPPPTTFRPRSRRTLSLPFAPNLPASKAAGPMLPPPRPSPRLRSPFAVPASVLKAPTVSTSVSTSPSMASLSTFSSWDLPVAADAASVVGRHRVLSHLESYNLPQPSAGSSARSLPTPIRPRLTSSPSSYSSLSPPTAARLRMERSHTQPLVSSRLSQTGAGSPASSSGSRPSSLRRAATITHHRPSPSTNDPQPPAQGPAYLNHHIPGHPQAGGGHRTQKVPKLRMPTSYSLQNCRELPPTGPLSPSNSTDGLSLVRTRSRDRRGSVSSSGSNRDGYRFPGPTLSAEASAQPSGMARSSSAVSLAGLINFGRRPSVKDPALVRAQQEELARKAAVAAALQAEEDDSDDDAPYLSYRTM